MNFLKRFMPFVFAGILGLVAVILMQRYLTQQRLALEAERRKLYADYQNPIDVLIAKRDIPEGNVIAREDLAFASIPPKFIQPYATSKGEDVLGLMARAQIAEGEQVLLNKLVRPEEAPAGATLSSVTPKGKRAVTLGTDELTGVGGFVRPGDTVDILWIFRIAQPGQQEAEPVTITLFENVPVLAVGSEMVGKTTSEQEPSQTYTVTIALTPDETSLLLFAREQGQIQLSLRSRADQGKELAQAPKVVNMTTLMESVLGKESMAEPPSRPPQRTVEVYKGLERSVVPINE